MTIEKILSNISSNFQSFPLFTAFTDFNRSKTQKRIRCLIKDDCIYHKHWYEPVNNDNNEPKHIQIDRCTFGLLAKGGCNVKCASYIPMDQKDNGIR